MSPRMGGQCEELRTIYAIKLRNKTFKNKKKTISVTKSLLKVTL